jgi:hypothetical protein
VDSSERLMRIRLRCPLGSKWQTVPPLKCSPWDSLAEVFINPPSKNEPR